jgi:hypothetical protein
MSEYPLAMWRPASGHSQDCYSAAEETDLKLRGYERLHGEVEFQQFPMWVSGDGLPPLLVEGPQEAQDAVARGYHLPDDAAIAAAREGFAAAHTPSKEIYTPHRFPLMLRHPLHRDAIPTRWVYDIDGTGTPIPGAPEKYPDKVANNPEEERAARALGWTGPALPAADEPPARVSVDAREYEELLALKRGES